MNKEISLKKFLLCLFLFLLGFSLILYFVFSKAKPLCKIDSPCRQATCNECIEEEGKRVCKDCNLFNEKDERIWTGGCIFEH